MIKSIIQDICQYAINNDLCNLSQGGTSLYEINFKENNNYPIIFVSPSSVNSVGVNVVKYSFTIYYLDRLLKDNSNDIDVLNDSNTVLQKLINIIRNFEYVLKVDDNYNITNFSDSSHLADCVAGGYVNLSITVQNTQGICAIDAVLPTIKVVLQNKNIKIEENGDYLVTFDNGYTGLKEVIVDVNIDTDSFYQEGYNEGFSKGETEGYSEGYSEGEVNGREQQKSLLESIKITENGVYSNENGYSPIDVKLDTESYYNNGYNEGFSKGETEGYETGYNEGYTEGEVNGVEQGKAEQKSLLESITITENGVFTNENGYDEVIVDVPTGGGDTGDYEEGYNKGYEEGVANAEEEIAETAQVLRITENGRYTTKYTDVSVDDAVVTGYFDDGTPFYNYGFCNKISYDTGIKVTPTTTLELWYMSDKWADESDTAIVATQNSENYGAIFKIIKHYANIKAEISRQSISAPNPMVNGEWYHLKLSHKEGFWVNGEFIGNISNNVTEPTFELCINSFVPSQVENSSSSAYFGMIKIDNQIIIPTEQGFYNVTTDSYLDAITGGSSEYVYTEAKSDFTGNLIKEVIVDVPTSTVEGEYTQEEVDEMCTNVYEASSQILDYLNSTGENVEYTITENGHHSFEADTYFNEVTINIKVPTSSGEDALHNFNDLGYQTDDVVYMGNPATMKDDLDYSYNKKVEFDGSINYFNNDTQLVYAPYINFEGIESDSLDSFFAGCENMLCVPHYTLWWETHYADRFFENCSKLKSFKITSTYIDSINYMCSNCVNLNELSIYSDSESIGAEGAFYNCHNLEYIPQIGSLGEFYLINSDTFYSCFKLKKIENIINSYGTIYDFVYCYSLEDVKIKLNDSGDFAIDLSYSHKLKWDCIKFLIGNADEGYSHTIKLHSSLEEKYHQESDFVTYMTMAEERGITFEYVSIEIPTEYL